MQQVTFISNAIRDLGAMFWGSAGAFKVVVKTFSERPRVRLLTIVQYIILPSSYQLAGPQVQSKMTPEQCHIFWVDAEFSRIQRAVLG